MNGIDIALIILLVVCAARGFWRGFIRELFGFAALVIGLGVALQYTEAGAAMLERVVDLPAATRTAIAFIAMFMVVHTAGNLLGFVVDRLVASATLRSLGGVAGAFFGVAKAATIAAFVLLFFEVFPMVPLVEAQIRESRIARPLASLAGNVLRAGLRQPAGRGEAARA